MLCSTPRELEGTSILYDIVVHSHIMDQILDDDTHNTKDLVG